MRQPNLGVHVDHWQPLSSGHVDPVVDDDDLRWRMPSCSRMSRIASDAAMNRSTCRYFQRENE